MNACPLRALGGSSPVDPIFRHSMTVVFPAPFRPTMSVSGFGNCITCSLSGENDRMPLINNYASMRLARSSVARLRRPSRAETSATDEFQISLNDPPFRRSLSSSPVARPRARWVTDVPYPPCTSRRVTRRVRVDERAALMCAQTEHRVTE